MCGSTTMVCVCGAVCVEHQPFKVKKIVNENKTKKNKLITNLLYKAAVFFVCLSVPPPPFFFRHDRRTATKFGKHIRVDMGLILS